MQNKITEITYKSLLFLAGQQKANGGFLSLTSADKNQFENSKTHSTTFFTASILNCLNSLPASALADSIKKKSARFLLLQKSKLWSFNYWQRNSAESKIKPYPDDLDDTSCALAALAGFNPKLITGNALANVVKLLAATEEKPGGPYRTWLVYEKDEAVWWDIDKAVNANVLWFLSLQNIGLPNMTDYLDNAIKFRDLHSRYYPDIFPVAYFISRGYTGKYRDRLIRQLLSRRRASFSWGNPLYTSMAISALINLGFRKIKVMEKSADLLVKSFKGKCWPSYAFCLDPAKENISYYAGSPALTTAFCLEALNKLEALKKQAHEQSRIKATKPDPQEEKIYRAVTSQVKQRFSTLAPGVKNYALEALDRTLDKDPDRQITLLPFHFRQALGNNGDPVTDEQMIALGTANLYGWIAYTIYDDFFDGEGNVNFLPVANAGLREVPAFYNKIFGSDKGNSKLANKILDNIDAANAWESQFCRVKVIDSRFTVPKELPDFKNLRQLADKSLGHALGPVAIMLQLNFKCNSWEIKNTLSFFTHYLIARQLNDDAHDWLADLRAGRINSIGANILKLYKKQMIDFKRDEQKLQKLFWNNVLPQAAQTIFKHVKSARLALSDIGTIEMPDMLLHLLDRPEAAARQALEETKKMQDFLKSY